MVVLEKQTQTSMERRQSSGGLPSLPELHQLSASSMGIGGGPAPPVELSSPPNSPAGAARAPDSNDISLELGLPHPGDNDGDEDINRIEPITVSSGHINFPEFGVIENNLAVSGLMQAQNGASSSAFATSRFADQSQSFALANMKIDSIDCLDRPSNTTEQA